VIANTMALLNLLDMCVPRSQQDDSTISWPVVVAGLLVTVPHSGDIALQTAIPMPCAPAVCVFLGRRRVQRGRRRYQPGNGTESVGVASSCPPPCPKMEHVSLSFREKTAAGHSDPLNFD
jgi:hypothetical protein